MAPLIFIYDGILPNYCFYSLKLANKYSNTKIILLITKNNKKIPKNVEYHFIEDFYKQNLSNKINFTDQHKNFWKGFWIKTIERFFILESFCKREKHKSFFHAELDNIVFNIDNLDKKLDQFGENFFFTKDRPERGLAGFIYLNSIGILSEFCNFVLDNLKENFLNDMQLLGKFSKAFRDKCRILPNEIDAFQNDKSSNESIDISNIGGIIDGAKIGTFLFGIDPRISNGLVFNRIQPTGDDNKTNFDYKNLLFYFSSSKKEFLIKDKITSRTVKIYNLHIHSKLFKKLSNEKLFLSILEKINLNRRTLMTINTKNLLKSNMNNFKKFFTIN